jgi:hypothetical protein
VHATQLPHLRRRRALHLPMGKRLLEKTLARCFAVVLPSSCPSPLIPTAFFQPRRATIIRRPLFFIIQFWPVGTSCDIWRDGVAGHRPR